MEQPALNDQTKSINLSAGVARRDWMIKISRLELSESTWMVCVQDASNRALIGIEATNSLSTRSINQVLGSLTNRLGCPQTVGIDSKLLRSNCGLKRWFVQNNILILRLFGSRPYREKHSKAIASRRRMEMDQVDPNDSRSREVYVFQERTVDRSAHQRNPGPNGKVA